MLTIPSFLASNGPDKTNEIIICLIIGVACIVGFITSIFWVIALAKRRKRLKNSFDSFGTHKSYYNLLMLWLSCVITFGFLIGGLITLGIGIGDLIK